MRRRSATLLEAYFLHQTSPFHCLHSFLRHSATSLPLLRGSTDATTQVMPASPGPRQPPLHHHLQGPHGPRVQSDSHRLQPRLAPTPARAPRPRTRAAASSVRERPAPTLHRLDATRQLLNNHHSAQQPPRATMAPKGSPSYSSQGARQPSHERAVGERTPPWRPSFPQRQERKQPRQDQSDQQGQQRRDHPRAHSRGDRQPTTTQHRAPGYHQRIQPLQHKLIDETPPLRLTEAKNH